MQTLTPSSLLSRHWRHMEYVNFSPMLESPWIGDANEDRDESGDTELLQSDDEEEESNSLASISLVEKPSATGEVEKSALPSPLDMQDVCKRTAARLNIPWHGVQSEVVKSRFDGEKYPKAKKTGKHVLPVSPELLDEI